MWKIEAKQLISVFRDGIGERWTAFLDALLRTQAAVCSVPDSAIISNQRVNLADLGVNTQVNVAVPAEPTGRLQTATCWQYKAEAYKLYTPSPKNRKLANEINKPHAQELIRQGFGYRIAVCDSLPPATKDKWERLLKSEKETIQPGAPDPLVVTADDIAAWANRFPGLLRLFFRQEFSEVHDLGTWGLQAKQTTKTYVPAPAWQTIQEALAQHVDLSQPCHDVGFSLQGEAGVGKSRGAYESISQVPGASGLVLYTCDEQLALRVGRLLMNEQDAHAILVADECMVETRVRLEDQLRAVGSRIRLVTITNSGIRPATGAPEFWLEHLSHETLQEILALNFPAIPQDRRALYANLAGGFVRFAVQLCRDHALIESHGLMASTSHRIQEYLRLVIGADGPRADILQALSLVRRVGYRDDVSGELDALCTLLALDRGLAQQVAYGMKDVPGFVAVGGRYFYITPAIVAGVALELAWQRWVAPDAAAFLKRVPSILYETFQQRVAELGTPDIRKVVSDFFLDWLRHLEPDALTHLDTTKRVVQLVETDPDRNLPTLRSLIQRTPIVQLLTMTGESRGGEWGPRRQLVWLVERLARFPQYFYDAEAILQRLATAESEPRIGNNATHIWQQLFRVYLSGSSMPFRVRLAVLEERLRADDQAIVDLAVRALPELFSTHAMRMEGRPIVAGQITPPDWRPESASVQRACYQDAFALVCKIARDNSARAASMVKEFLVHNLRLFLSRGEADTLREVLAPHDIPVELIPVAIEQIEKFLHFEVSRDNNTNQLLQKEAYLAHVRKWLAEFRPEDFSRRLVATIGLDSWAPSMRDGAEKWQSEVERLAREIIQTPSKLSENMAWLCSPNARSADILGQHLGRIARGRLLLDVILPAAEQSGSTGLVCGYMRGWIEAEPSATEAVNDMLDELQTRSPRVAYDVIVTIGDSVGAVTRLLKLVDSGKLPASQLRGILFALRGRRLTGDELLAVMQRLLMSSRDEPNAIDAAINVLSHEVHKLDKKRAKELFASGSLREIVISILIAYLEVPGRESYSWFETVKALEQAGTEDLIPIVVQGLVGENISLRDQAEQFLVEHAGRMGLEIMTALEKVMRDKKRGLYFFVCKYVQLIAALPLSVVKEWLGRVGVEGARIIARHLPAPHLADEGVPEVPPVTEYVLREFENDERTFEGFCAGTASHEFYWTEGGKKRERDAEVAEMFLHHPVRRIREWARMESQAARQEAERERLQDEEEKALL